MTEQLRKMIHVGCKRLRMDDDDRHDLQFVTTGKTSMTDMTEADLRKVVMALKEKGFDPSFNGPRRPMAKRNDTKFCHVLWGKLVRAGVVEVAGAKGLNAFVRARFGRAWGAEPIDIDTMRNGRQIADIIEALKGMCRRNHIPVDRGRK